MNINYSKHFTPILNHFFQTQHNVTIESYEFQSTRKEFEGDLTLVVFPLVRQVKIRPDDLANTLGNYLLNELEAVLNFNVVKGFLNLVLSDAFYVEQFLKILNISNYGHQVINDVSPIVMVEFSSPNTNKPLHLGHIRNNVLGYSVAKILEANGKKVIKTQIINDRGIHICKSMIAWEKFGNQETPSTFGLKGDQLVGKYYIKFDIEYKKEITTLTKQGYSEEEAKQNAPLLLEAQDMLRRWEDNDLAVHKLWRTMNDWVYQGFEVTYASLGVSFDSYYYESETYLLGKDLIEDGLSRSIFYKKEDGSVWIDLSDEGLDEKLLLRSDGTAVYMTQDLGTALQRYRDNPSMTGLVYTVGNEQDYHFQVLFLVLKKLGYDWAQSLFHLSYGMVDLPQGKMKSREGTVVDADDLMIEMQQTAQTIAEDLGKLDDLSVEEKASLYRTIGMGALKYFILKVDPKKRILFDPESSVDFAGNTGPFIQYTYARIQSILRKADHLQDELKLDLDIDPREKEIIKHLMLYPTVIQQAAKAYSPAIVANYSYDLVKLFNSFYQNVSILGETEDAVKTMRVVLSSEVASVLHDSLGLLGIQVPDRM